MTRSFFVKTVFLATLSAALMADANHPTGTRGLLLIDKVGSYIRFFDPVTFKERSSIAVATKPHDFVLTADRKTAYVPLYGDGIFNRNPNPGHEVVIVDMDAAKVVGSIDTSPYRAPHGIQIGPDGMVYVASDLDRKLLVLDPKTRKMTKAIDTEGTTHWIGILPNGTKIYATNKNDPFVTVVNLKTLTVASKIPVPGGTEGIAVSPDGTRVIVMAHTEPGLVVIDPAKDTIVDRIALQSQKTSAYKAYFSPDGKTALSANHGDGSVSVIDLEKGQVVQQFQAGTGIETLTYY